MANFGAVPLALMLVQVANLTCAGARLRDAVLSP